MSATAPSRAAGEDSAGAYDPNDHGWWPYVTPYLAFMLIGEVGARLPDAADPWVLALKPLIVLGLILWFWKRGRYPEWRGDAARIGFVGGLMDIVVGLALTVVWVAPFYWIEGLRPEPGGEFDPAMAGIELVPVILLLRAFGYAVVTPLFEELFIRNFVMRIADVWNSDQDFRDQPLARYSALSLVVSTIVFTAGHVPWEWWVCVPWVVLSSLWFYARKSLSSVMLVHGVTNAALLALAIWGGELLENADGSYFSFWFFV